MEVCWGHLYDNVQLTFSDGTTTAKRHAGTTRVVVASDNQWKCERNLVWSLSFWSVPGVIQQADFLLLQSLQQ